MTGMIEDVAAKEMLHEMADALRAINSPSAHKLITPAPSSDTKSDIAQPIQPPTVKGPETKK